MVGCVVLPIPATGSRKAPALTVNWVKPRLCLFLRGTPFGGQLLIRVLSGLSESLSFTSSSPCRHQTLDQPASRPPSLRNRPDGDGMQLDPEARVPVEQQ